MKFRDGRLWGVLLVTTVVAACEVFNPDRDLINTALDDFVTSAAPDAPPRTYRLAQFEFREEAAWQDNYLALVYAHDISESDRERICADKSEFRVERFARALEVVPAWQELGRFFGSGQAPGQCFDVVIEDSANMRFVRGRALLADRFILVEHSWAVVPAP